MIHNSSPWKAQLARDADLIERWSAKPNCSERRSFLIERKVFLAAYSMRKLSEAAKLSAELFTGRMKVLRFPSTRSGYSAVNNHQFDKYFDLRGGRKIELPRSRLLNLLVHSLVFVEVLDDAERFESFMVTSDHERSKGLIQVEIVAFLGLMRAAADDYPTSIVHTRDKTTGDWRTWAGHGELPTKVR